jgi:protein gp37
VGDSSKIEWTDATWNPVTGCSKVSPGCAHCYAETLALTRLAGKPGYPGLPWTPENALLNVVERPERLDQPLRWRRPRMVFVNSMSDLFHEEVSDEFIARVFTVMAAAPQHVFQVLTKRPERMRDCVRGLAWEMPGDGSRGEATIYRPAYGLPAEPLPNVWLGTSIENRRYVQRADLLRETPAAVRFISAEPLLGPLVHDDFTDNDVNGGVSHWRDSHRYRGPELDLTNIDWLIVGGESGPGHRPMQAEWVRDLRDACYESRHRYSPLEDARLPGNWTGTRFFFKQWGGAKPTSRGRELDGRTWDEMPSRIAA